MSGTLSWLESHCCDTLFGWKVWNWIAGMFEKLKVFIILGVNLKNTLICFYH